MSHDTQIRTMTLAEFIARNPAMNDAMRQKCSLIRENAGDDAGVTITYLSYPWGRYPIAVELAA